MKTNPVFLGKKPKDNATHVRQVGHTGSVQNKTTSIPTLHENVKQAKSNPAATSYTRKETVRQVGSTGRDA